MDKDNILHIYSGILLSHKKLNNCLLLQIMPFAATQVDLEIIILREVSQRKKNIIWYHLYVKSKNDTNDLIYKTEIDLQTWKSNLWFTSGVLLGSDYFILLLPCPWFLKNRSFFFFSSCSEEEKDPDFSGVISEKWVLLE